MLRAESSTPFEMPQVGLDQPRHLLLQFAYLQALDILTTMAFLMANVQEANPLVRVAIRVAGSPLAGLFAVKIGAIGLGGICWLQGRYKLLQRVNVFFAALVAWNLLCLILGLGLHFRN